MDTVLWGGLAFLVAVGIAFLAMGKVDKSSLADRHKRVINFFILGALVALTFAVFQWHSATYMANY
ncbi:diguanylate cyclase [Alphaproteobacteria bacterium]|jgi:hypothetical protein|nr:diguanylate cyclase [Alphaproteobacteria bacterium]